MKKSRVSVGYRWAVLAAGAAAAIRMLTQPGQPNAAAFLVLLFLACASAHLKVRLPGIHRSVSLSFAISFAAITELPPAYAFWIVGLSFLYEIVLDDRSALLWEEVAFHLAATAVATLATYHVYSYLHYQLGLQRLLSLATAGAVYFAVSSMASSIEIGIDSSTAPWVICNRTFFWAAPLYMLTPVAVELTRTLLEASGPSERLLALALILVGYRYVKHYFARLHDQQNHARKLDEIRERAIECLAVAIEARDGATAGHLQRVKRYALRLARKLNFSDFELRTLELGAVLHDVGKVSVPDDILRKPGRLTEREFSQISVHTTVGAEIVSAVQFPCPVEELVLSHHEHWDGSGYPRQLVGFGIPLLARVLTVVDCLDALITDRPYRGALPVERAVELMREQRGKIFDPQILDAFLAELPAFEKELERELEMERNRERLVRSTAAKVRQTWLTEAESKETSLRREAMERLARMPEQLVLLYDILQLLGAEPDVQLSLKRTPVLLQRLIPHDKAGVFALEGEHYVLLQGEAIPGHAVSRLTMPAAHGVLAQAAAARRPIVVEVGPAESLPKATPRYLEGIRSALAAPLLVDERVIGGILLCSPAPDSFDEEQAFFVGLITGKLAATVHSALALQQLRFDAAADPNTKLAGASYPDRPSGNRSIHWQGER